MQHIEDFILQVISDFLSFLAGVSESINQTLLSDTAIQNFLDHLEMFLPLSEDLQGLFWNFTSYLAALVTYVNFLPVHFQVEHGLFESPYVQELSITVDVDKVIDPINYAVGSNGNGWISDYSRIQIPEGMVRRIISLPVWDCESGTFDQELTNEVYATMGILVDSIFANRKEPIAMIWQAGGNYYRECNPGPPSLSVQIAELIGVSNAAGGAPNEAEPYRLAIEECIRRLTTGRISQGKQPVLKYEGYNVFDIFNYYVGGRDEFYDRIMTPFLQAVENMEIETGLDLEVALPSVSSFAGFDVDRISLLVEAANERGLDFDYINWQYYICYPMYSLDGQDEYDTGLFGELVDFLIGRINPLSNAKDYYDQVTTIKEAFPNKKTYISEWTITVAEPGDYRNASYERAGMNAAVLSEMQYAGLDIGMHFTEGLGRFDNPNDFFLFSLTDDGEILEKPGVHPLRWWAQLPENQIEIEGWSPGDHSHDVSMVAAKEDGQVTLLIGRYQGLPNTAVTTIDVKFKNLPAGEYEVTIHSVDENTVIGDVPHVETLFTTLSPRLPLSLDIKAQSAYRIEIQPVTGFVPQSELKAYPIPAREQISVLKEKLAADENTIVHAEIFDLDGRLMKDVVLNNGTTTIDVSDLATGVYILRTTSGDGVVKKKKIVIKQ